MEEDKIYKKFKLSETAVLFIQKYAIPELKIENIITEKIQDEIFNFATDCELNMIDENGCDKDYDYMEKERDILGDKYVSEVSGQWALNLIIDLDDLNERLGLK